MDVILSLIIPTFNSHKDLERLLASLALINRELDQVQIIVVDDGSCDDTRKIVQSLIGRFKSLDYYYQRNKGPAAARNLGAKNARGKYLVFIDDDCLISSGFFEAIKAFYEKNEGYVGLGIKAVNSSKGVLTEYNQRLGNYLIESSKGPNDSYGFVSSRCYSFSKDSFWTVNGHDEDFIWAAGEDRDFCLRINKSNMRIFYLQTVSVINADQLSLRGFIKQNFGYGFGAGLFMKKHPGLLSFKSSRYIEMLCRLSKDSNFVRRFKLIATFFLAQACTMAGIISYRINKSIERKV